MSAKAAASHDYGIFERLLDIWLPDGGLMASLVEFYADESYSEERSSLFCVAGYLFEKDQAIRFKRRWQAMLDRYCLLEFHMTDCAHRTGGYEKLSEAQCDEAAREAIAIILETTAYGFALSVDEKDYAEVFQPFHKELISAYSFSLLGCLAGVSDWMEKTGFTGDVAYTFEAGYEHEREAHRVMSDLRSNPDSTRRFHILTHAFSEKKKVLPLQAADILAWHWMLDTYRRSQGARRTHPVRKDFVALIRPQDRAMDWTREMLIQVREFTSSLARRSS